MKFLSPIVLIVLVLSLIAGAGCATKQQSGAAGGAVAGGVLGEALTGSAAGALVGAAFGALLGSEIGRALDRRDQQYMVQTLETTETYGTRAWQNPDTGYEYEMTPTRTYYRDEGTPCREFVLEADIGGRPEEVYGTACRQADGSWKILEGAG